MGKIIIILVSIGLWYAYQEQWFDLSSVGDNSNIYRYQDEQGQWHYTDQAPANGTAETVTMPSNGNVLPRVLTKDAPSLNDNNLSAARIVDNVVSYMKTLGNGPDVIEQAKQVQQQSVERQKALDDLAD